MIGPLTAQKVLTARSDLPALTLESADELYASSWLASHVRLCRLLPDGVADLPILLAYVLTRNPAEDIPLERWMPHNDFLPTTPSDLSGLIGQALSDLQEGEQDDGRHPDTSLKSILRSLVPGEARLIHSIEPATVESMLPYEHGPTEQMFWFVDDHFYYLEVHHES